MDNSYIAFLRGVNVGQNTLKMQRVRELWAELGFNNVRTYVQSGNVLFEAVRPSSTRSSTMEEAWSSMLEQRLAGETRLPVAVFLRSIADLKRIIAGNPFVKEEKIDRSKLHLTLLASAAGHDAFGKFRALNFGADRFHLSGKEVYLYCPNGYGRTKLSNNRLEKLLSIRATTRNWNTSLTLSS